MHSTSIPGALLGPNISYLHAWTLRLLSSSILPTRTGHPAASTSCFVFPALLDSQPPSPSKVYQIAHIIWRYDTSKYPFHSLEDRQRSKGLQRTATRYHAGSRVSSVSALGLFNEAHYLSVGGPTLQKQAPSWDGCPGPVPSDHTLCILKYRTAAVFDPRCSL